MSDRLQYILQSSISGIQHFRFVVRNDNGSNMSVTFIVVGNDNKETVEKLLETEMSIEAIKLYVDL